MTKGQLKFGDRLLEVLVEIWGIKPQYKAAEWFEKRGLISGQPAISRWVNSEEFSNTVFQKLRILLEDKGYNPDYLRYPSAPKKDVKVEPITEEQVQKITDLQRKISMLMTENTMLLKEVRNLEERLKEKRPTK